VPPGSQVRFAADAVPGASTASAGAIASINQGDLRRCRVDAEREDTDSFRFVGMKPSAGDGCQMLWSELRSDARDHLSANQSMPAA
jgi:hypothetical protein